MNDLVSVIMSVHNEKREYLELAIQSICNQTYPAIEFIIINDASGEECSSYLEEICAGRQMIHLYKNEENLGVTSSLNKGLAMAQGKYIARMDADDFSCPDRIHKQVSYLEKKPYIDILGTCVVSFGDKVIYMSPSKKMDNDEIQCELFFTSALCHPSVMIRHSFLKCNSLTYDECVRNGQDYDLWERSSILGNLEILGDVLLFYRIHSAQITSTNKDQQIGSARKIMLRRLNRIGICPTEDDFKKHMALKGIERKRINDDEMQRWMNVIISANVCQHLVKNKTLLYNLNRRMFLYRLHNNGRMKAGDSKYFINIAMERIIMLLKLQCQKRRFKKLIVAAKWR